ncbi:MAG: recombinase family protein [Burkholderiales bacterium]
MAVALYARVSTTRQAENDLSIPDQLRQLRDWCKANGLAVGAEYVESGASATDDRRPEFQRMIADAVRLPSPFEAIVVHSRSRFFRDLFESLRYERILKRADVRVISITQVTSNDPAGEMASKLFSLFDEYQSQENAKHTQRAMRENARQGFWNGSIPPYGYRTVATRETGNRGRKKRRLEIDPAEAEIVEKIYDLYLHGAGGVQLGMKGVAAQLNARGITMRGRPWRAQKINQVVSDPLYTGTFHFNRRDSKTLKVRPQTEWIAVEIPAIIDAGRYERAARRRAAADPKMAPPRAASSRAPLVGILRCGHCGAGMAQASGKSGHYRYYKCTTRLNKNVAGCDSLNLPRDKADRLVLEALAERVFTPSRVGLMLRELHRRQRAARTVENARVLKLRKELDRATEACNRLLDAVERGALPMDELLRARAQKLQARRQDVLLELAQAHDRARIGLQKIDPAKIDTFCQALKDRLTDPTSGFGKAYLRLLVDEIRLEGRELKIRGSYSRIADAIGLLEKKKLGEVPSFVRDWRARQDLNPRPPGS